MQVNKNEINTAIKNDLSKLEKNPEGVKEAAKKSVQLKELKTLSATFNPLKKPNPTRDFLIKLNGKLEDVCNKPPIKKVLNFLGNSFNAYARVGICSKNGIPPSAVDEFIFANKAFSQSQSITSTYIKHFLYKLPLPEGFFKRLKLK